MTQLSVNLNKVALLRNARPLDIPNVIHAARCVLDAGAYGVTVHPRPDERHIRRADVFALADLLKREYPQAEYNIEGNPFHNLMDIARALQPVRQANQYTLVPDAVGASTSDHGWDLRGDTAELKRCIDELHALGARVSLFLDAVPEGSVENIARAATLGADRIELYTEPYAAAYGTPEQEAVLAQYVAAAQAARNAGLGVNAGHDLNTHNLPRFIQAIPDTLEVSIGHALTADALTWGFAETVRRYLRACNAGIGGA